MIRNSLQPISSFVIQFGQLCNDYRFQTRETQVISFSSTSTRKIEQNFYRFPFSQDYYLINTFAGELLRSSRSLFILSNNPEPGISTWCQLCTHLSSSFCPGSARISAITGTNKTLPLFSGEVGSAADFWKVIKAAGAIGCHHYCSFEKEEENGRSCLTLWNLSVTNEDYQLDRGWNVLKDILTMKINQNTFIPFGNSEITKALEVLIEAKLESTVLLVDETTDTLEMAELIQKVFLEEKKNVIQPFDINMYEVNALKNELFVLENDTDAYEDEIRRLNRTLEEKNEIIRSLQNKSLLVFFMKSKPKGKKVENQFDLVIKLVNDALEGKTLSIDEKLQMAMYPIYIYYYISSECDTILKKGHSTELLEQLFNQQIRYLIDCKSILIEESTESFLSSLCHLNSNWQKRVHTICSLLETIVLYLVITY